MLSTIWDVYNHLKARRNYALGMLETYKRATGYSKSSPAVDQVMLDLEAEAEFLTSTLAGIDVGQGRPTEADA